LIAQFPEMMKTLYLNLEDDVTKVINKLKRETADEVVLVFPKKSFIFSDSINLRLLKKQVDMLGKQTYILTMDERGQMYAQDAGFELKRLPAKSRANSFSDIRPRTAPVPETVVAAAGVAAVEADPIPAPAQTPTRARIPAQVFDPFPRRATRPTKAVSKISSAAASTSRVRSAGIASASTIAAKDNVYIPVGTKNARIGARRSYRAYAVGFIALALIVSLLLFLVVLPSATLIVYAKSQVVARDIDVTADVKAQIAESSKLTLPAVAVDENQTITDTFPINGKKEVGSKAEGRITIYNLTGSPLALKAATTTLTVGSKTYSFKQDQPTVKALTSASSDANATVADIVASDGGESFNLPAGTRVEITNQAFGSQPQRLYAKTVTQVIGGNSRFISVVSKEDLDNAQKVLTQRVIDGINGNLAGSNSKLVDGAYNVTVGSFTPDKAEGTESQNFTAELKVQITGLAFNEGDLKNMIRQRLLMSLGAGKNLQDVGSDTVIYRIKNLDIQNGLMQLSLHYESNAKPNITSDDIKNRIIGKSKQEASDLILTNPDIDRVEITIQPAWQNSIPRFGSKIHLEIKE
jgi:hypothetical protein